MFKSAVIASVCAIGISAVNLDIEAELSASVDSHKKRRYFNPGPRLIVVDQGPNYPPPPPPRPRTPTPRVIRRVQRPVYQPVPIVARPAPVYYGGYYGGYGYGRPVYGGYGYGGYGYGGYGYGRPSYGYGGYGHGKGYGGYGYY